jgi:hypothetical protein
MSHLHWCHSAFPAVILAFLVAQAGHAQAYYVAPSGSDENPGTLARPFRTIQHAADVMTPGDTCFVREGVYRETVRPGHSGEKSKPITFAAYRNEKVVVSGADLVTDWKAQIPRVYRAPADWTFNQLFVDGVMMNLARWPNSPLDPMHPTWAVAGKGTDSNTIVDPNLPPLDLNGAVMHILPGAQWVSWTRPIRDYDAKARSFKFEGSWNQDWAHAVKEDSRYYLEGLPVLLDAPGEWCVERGTVNLWMPHGGDPNHHRVEAKRREFAFDLSGREYICLEGFRIFAATITMRDARHCVVRKCHLRYASHFGDTEGWGTRYHTASGVIISGSDNQLRDSSVVFSAGNGVTLLGEHNVVRNCLVRDVDYMAVDCGAVWAEGQGNVISRNTLCNTGRSIVVHRALKGGRIEYNDMHDAGLLTTDLGITYCFQTDGAGTVIAHNLAHHNRAASCGVGIYIDNGSSNFIIHHNVSFSNPDSGIRLNTPSHNNLVCNNTIVNNGNSVNYWGPNDDRDEAGCRLINNIFTDAVVTGNGIEVSHNFSGKQPGFVDAANGDFRLRSDSPCIDAGMIVPGVTGRFAGKAPDLGAYECGRWPWRAGHDWGEPPAF